MKRKVLIGIVLAFCTIFPINAMENTELPFTQQKAIIIDLPNSVSGNSVSGNDYNFEVIHNTDENTYEIYRNQLKAQLCNRQIEYLSNLYAFKSEVYDITKLKYDLGYVTDADVKEAKMQVKAVELQIDTVKAQKEFFIECIQLRGGEYEEHLLEEEFFQLTKGYVSSFLEQSDQLKSYEQQINTYEQYLNANGLEEKDKHAIKNQLVNLQIDKKNYEIALKEYVMQLQLQYGTMLREIQQYDNEIVVMQIKIQNQKLLCEAGKVAKITLTELEVVLQQLEYERLSKVSDAQLILYLLEHTVENKTV